jgi:pyridoxamine 5'-phosphate oxidase
MSDIRRIDYNSGPLMESDLAATPLAQFTAWLERADAAGIEEPNAMTVATVDAEGQPHARVLLCKEVTADGFIFFTNYESDKAAHISANPRLALCFHWQPMHRQVRVTGRAERLPAADSDAYFASRPRDAQLGAWTSEQSRVISDRELLRTRLQEVTASWPGQVRRPSHWGGYLVRPQSLEFWQGQPSRLHDRLRYVRVADGSMAQPGAWTAQRLAP